MKPTPYAGLIHRNPPGERRYKGLLSIFTGPPKLPPPPRMPPLRNDAEERERKRRLRLDQEARKRRRGRGQTILTSGLGDTDEAPVEQKTLLG